MLVFLVGYMGSGKSSIGRKLASRLGFDFLDTDREIERGYGATIGEIFEREGEGHFRMLERQALESLRDRARDTVVATGGGMPCRGGNIELMNELGLTVYLKMSPGKLASRLEGGRSKRPIIRDMDDEQLLEFVRKNLAEREPYYGNAALVVECDGAADEYVCREVERCVGWIAK